MGLNKEPFRKYNLEEKSRDNFTCSLNKEERGILEASKKILEQPKDSTALKTLAWIGAKVIQEPKTAYILQAVFKNKLNNERVGIADFE